MRAAFSGDLPFLWRLTGAVRAVAAWVDRLAKFLPIVAASPGYLLGNACGALGFGFASVAAWVAAFVGSAWRRLRGGLP